LWSGIVVDVWCCVFVYWDSDGVVMWYNGIVVDLYSGMVV